MEKCPFCGAETRPGDNFCLHCGNRLPQMTPSSVPQQAQQGIGETTVASPDEWGSPSPVQSASSPASWSDAGFGGGSTPDAPTVRADSPSASIQGPANNNAIENQGKLILRSETGEILKEYPLDKPEISIGRAPNSDILLSKDKLTSRRHATVRYEDGKYILRDERSANGTFVNSQQIEEMVPRVLQDGDHVGIGEHELIFRLPTPASSVTDLPTVLVPFDQQQPENTFRTKPGEEVTTSSTNDEYNTKSMAESEVPAPPAPAWADYGTAKPNGTNGAAVPNSPAPAPSVPVSPVYTQPTVQSTPPPAPEAPVAPASAPAAPSAPVVANQSAAPADSRVTFNRFNSLSQPALPDLTALMAALSTLDGQVMSLQEQFNATQEAVKSHESEVTSTANQLRTAVRKVTDRMDNTIAEVATNREQLAWAELMQLLEDVMNNPRDIDYVSRLARKARELNKVFQLHQSVLNTMAECNSLLRGLIGEDR